VKIQFNKISDDNREIKIAEYRKKSLRQSLIVIVSFGFAKLFYDICSGITCGWGEFPSINLKYYIAILVGVVALSFLLGYLVGWFVLVISRKNNSF